jgi:hypothetical protein
VRRHAPALWVLAIVAGSFLLRTAIAWLRATPDLLPDEYIYSALGRSLATTGRPEIRGGAAHFPALLQPIVTAPAWLVGNVEISFRIVQATGALAMSLAAIPVYLLARRLELSQRVGLALAGLAVVVPDMVYASFLASEPFAYPLVLAAVAAAVAALARPTRRAQLAFVGFAALATLARAQFVVLPLVFFLASLGLGAAERRVRSALRDQILPLGCFLVPAIAAFVAGPARVLGYYRTALDLHVNAGSILTWSGWDAMALAYAAGWIIVPGALVGLWLALVRPASRSERAFAVTAGLLTIVLLGEAALLGGNLVGPAAVSGLGQIKERYIFYLVPLCGICFALYAKRGWPLRLQHLALAALLFVLAVRVPLSGFSTSGGLDASPILYGTRWLTTELDDTSLSSLAIAVAAGLLSAAAVAGSRRPTLGTPIALTLALLATASASAAAVAFDVTNGATVKRAYLPRNASFVDDSGLRDVALLQASNGYRDASLQQLFWNRSIDRVFLLPDAQKLDAFRAERVAIAADGSLRVGGRPIHSPLLVDGFGSWLRLRGARPVARGPASTLWAPNGRIRLALYARGRYLDGWLAGRGAITIWPATTGGRVRGRLRLTLSLPGDTKAKTMRFSHDGLRRVVRIAPGTSKRIVVPVCSSGPWQATFSSTSVKFAGSRLVSVKATEPAFTPDPSSCVGQKNRT